MKRLLPMTLTALLGLSLIPRANAEVLIEPLVGWSFNDKYDFSDSKDYSSGNGLSYGGRLGYQKLGLQLGVDYLRSEIDKGSNDFDDDVTTDQWAAFVGYKFPILFRVYAGYIFSSEADSKINGADLELNDGTGAKFGVGSTILPFLDVNLEYRRGTYDEIKVGGATRPDDMNFETVMLSVSLPLTF